MEKSSAEGLALTDAYYRDYGGRARALKGEGKRAIGYISAVAPVEIISAAGFIPIRIKGDAAVAVTRAPGMMETLVCPYVLSAFDLALKGRYDYLEGMVIPHTCDSVTRTYEVWKRNLPLPYYHFLNVPHLDDAPSVEFFTRVLGTFIGSLEQASGRKITRESLARAVASYNEQRQAMRGLYELRKRERPAISGVEMIKLLTSKTNRTKKKKKYSVIVLPSVARSGFWTRPSATAATARARCAAPCSATSRSPEAKP